MPAPWYPLPPSLKPLQLYRHLLREASYLPPAFRKTVDSTIRKRFHNNRPDGPHTKRRLSKAMSSLRTLRAANSGDKKAMEGLVMKGFGRTGVRRRELMAKFVKPQGPGDTEALESILDQAAAPSTPDGKPPADGSQLADDGHEASEEKTAARKSKNSFFEKWDRTKLLQFMSSQKQQQAATKSSASWPGTAVKSTDPDQFVPKTNIWGKPPAASLVTAKRAHWWRRSAEKVMPPLGRGEWDLLDRLSKGLQDAGEWAIPPRRAWAHSRTGSLTESAGQSTGPSAGTSGCWDWEAHAAAQTARVERPKTRARQRGTGQRDLGPYGGPPRSSEVSSRWFRRVYNRTWQITPSMEQDPNTLRYGFTWGTVAPNLPSATASQMQVFEGRDAQGNPLCGKSGD
ncbi:hypothetical protein E4U41_002267 [Claviceps citrina]|nr:hypothetical protein E4U41_002267 [Claviceps citrina]